MLRHRVGGALSPPFSLFIVAVELCALLEVITGSGCAIVVKTVGANQAAPSPLTNPTISISKSQNGQSTRTGDRSYDQDHHPQLRARSALSRCSFGLCSRTFFLYNFILTRFQTQRQRRDIGSDHCNSKAVPVSAQTGR